MLSVQKSLSPNSETDVTVVGTCNRAPLLWESCLHKSCKLSGFPHWNGSSAALGTRTVSVVFNMSDHDLLFLFMLGLKNTVRMKI